MKTCLYCGKALTGVQQKFCSVKCRNAHHYHNASTDKSPSPKHEPVENCIMCGKALSGRQTRFCSKDCKNDFHQAYPNQKKRGLERKLEMVQKLGGQCARCGYKKNLAALVFHHISDKNYKLDMRNLANRAFDAVVDEFEKCELLCANCHMELHYPYLDMDTLDVETFAAVRKIGESG